MKRLCLLTIVLILMTGVAMADKTVTMTLTGDVTLAGENWAQRRTDSFTTFYNNYGPDYFFANVVDLFKSDDITMVNLEGTLTDSSAQEDKGKTYRFRAPVSYVDILTRSSIDTVCIANNHIMDFGQQGYNSTVRTLTEAGVGFSAKKQVDVREVNGVKIAFFSLYSSSVNKLLMSGWCEDEIKRLKKEEGVNAVVFTFHSGQEYATTHNTAQKKMAYRAIESGADLVIMHHPHVVEGVEIYQNRYIFYSLGNFCFGGNVEVRALESMLVRAVFTFSDEGEYKGQQMDIYPFHASGTYPSCNYQPVPVKGEEAAQVITLIQNDSRIELEPFDEDKGCISQPYLAADGKGNNTVMMCPSSDRHN